MNTLILTVTRECNLRCSYCPTAKDGWPSLSEADARQAVDLFVDRFGGGDIKLFGGEPLLVPAVVRAAMEAARNDDRVHRVYLSTNGLHLDDAWLAYLADYPKAILTLSLDGRAADNRRHRRALAQVGDAYDHVVGLLPKLLRVPRVVVTQTIAPSLAGAAADNFAHLLELGFWRFNFLPGYFIRWRSSQLEALRQSFATIAALVSERWRTGNKTYVRNLFTRAPTPFFNTGLVVDADRSIHPSNLGLSSSLEELLGATRVGSLDDPPTADALAERAGQVNDLLRNALPPAVWQSTLAADAALTEFCQTLYPAFWDYRRRKREAAA